jgi:phytoene synthase
VRSFNLPLQHFHDVIDGMEMDLQYNRYPDFPTLQSYCHRVAGVVGLMAAEIFGYRDSATRQYAELLGTAFQLTNIIRDVGEDARRNRIYLPLDELARFGVASGDIARLHETEGFRRLMVFQIDRARDYYRRAFAALPREDRKAQRAGLVMAAIYQTTLDEIEAGGLKVLTSRTSLTPLRKLWIAWRTWLTA